MQAALDAAKTALAAEKPTQNDIDTAAQALDAAYEEFLATCADGTMLEGAGAVPTDPGKTTATSSKGGTKGGGLSRTGDPLAAAGIALVAVAATSAGAATLLGRRSSRRDR